MLSEDMFITPPLQIHQETLIYCPCPLIPIRVGGLFLLLPSTDSRETRTNYMQTKGGGPTTLMQAAASMPVGDLIHTIAHISHSVCPYIICPFNRVILVLDSL
ncbi:hypothetical protein HDV62DRAFT_312960 [Trichoderma sp. SZMC 28011]